MILRWILSAISGLLLFLNSSPPSPFPSFLGFCPPPSPLGPPPPGAVGFRVTLIVGKEGIKAPLKAPAASEAVLRTLRWAPARRLADVPGQDGLLGNSAGGRGRQAPTAAPPEWLRPGSQDVYSG